MNKEVFAKHFASAQINCAITIDFVPDGDMKVFYPIFRDRLRNSNDIMSMLNLHKCSSSSDLKLILDKIAYQAKFNGMQPILAFDGHGVATGLDFGNRRYDAQIADRCGAEEYQDIFPWSELLCYLRKINIACANNLVVFFSTCYGANLFDENIDMELPAPFYFGTAPIGEIKADRISNIYRNFCVDFLENTDSSSASEYIDENEFVLYYPELYCIRALIRLSERNRKDRSQVCEDVLTELRWRNPELQNIQISKLRSRIKECPANDYEALIRCLKDKFLMADDPRNFGRFNYSFSDVRNVF